MRRIRHLSVSETWEKALTEHLGEELVRETRAVRRARFVRFVFFPVVLAAMAALLFVLIHH